MKQQFTLLTLLAALALSGPLGCGKNDGTGGGQAAATMDAIKLDTAKLASAFASATGELKANFDRVMTAISDRDFSGAGEYLKKMAADANLTPEQKSAISDLVAQVKERSSEIMKSAGAAAGKAVDQIKEQAGQAVDQAKEAAAKAATQATDAASKAAGQTGDAVNKAAGDASKAAGVPK